MVYLLKYVQLFGTYFIFLNFIKHNRDNLFRNTAFLHINIKTFTRNDVQTQSCAEAKRLIDIEKRQ